MARMPMTQENFDKLMAVNKLAHEGADFDSGWIATPANKTIIHDLGVIPSETFVYASANKDGDPHSSDTFTLCDRSKIVITGPLAFCRVRIQKGSI